MHPSTPPSPESMNELNITNETTAEEVSIDEVAIIFSFLLPKDIMRARVCTTWREAAKKTLVPPTALKVDSLKSYNAMRAMSSALPNLQQLSISKINGPHKYSDGEDPDERRARYTANYNTHDINIISRFRKLRSLEIMGAHLSGRYPVLSTFPLLTKLSILDCIYLKFDLDMLVGLPLLKELRLIDNPRLTGNLGSLRVLRATLEKVIVGSRNIEGSFMDLADFPRLKELNLWGTVTGDIRDIGEKDFPTLESLNLPPTVRGGMSYKFQHISDVPRFMHAIHLLSQRSPPLFDIDDRLPAFYWRLSTDSPDWYDFDETIGCPNPPFDLQIIEAGSRLGWSWCTYDDDGCFYSCEINWLDPEPSSENCDYEAYSEELEHIERRISFYRGYHDPPTEEEYRRLCGVPASIPGFLMV